MNIGLAVVTLTSLASACSSAATAPRSTDPGELTFPADYADEYLPKISCDLDCDPAARDELNCCMSSATLKANQDACDAKSDAFACRRTGKQIASGALGHYDPPLAGKYLEKGAQLLATACEAGEVQKCKHAAQARESFQPELAINLWEKGCELGDLQLCVRLGQAFQMGWHMSPDLDRADAIFARACKGKNGAGCTSYAYRYHGDAPERADALYQQGCELGDGFGCVEFAKRVTGRDASAAHAAYRRAIELFLSECELRMAHGCSKAAWLISSGLGINGEPNPERIKKLNALACALGDTSVCENLLMD